MQVSEEMSLEANFSVMAVTDVLRQRHLDGVMDICPANASFLIRFDPDVLAPPDLEAAVRHGATHLRVGTAILGSRPPHR